MNLRDLKYLVTVAKLKHFGRAAEECNVSQPTLSMQLKKLEEFLGITLLERTSKKVYVTEAGQEIVDKAQEILQIAQDIKDIAKNYHDPFNGSFTLGAFPTLAPFIFPLILPKIQESFPNLSLYLVEEKTNDILDKLHRSEVDMAFLALPVDNHNLVVRKVFNDPFYVAVSKKHALSGEKDIKLDDLKTENLLLLEDGHCLSSQALEVCHWNPLLQMEHNINFRATSIETLRQMVAANLGVTLMPKMAVIENDPSINYIPISSPSPSRDIALVWRKSSPFSDVFHRIIDEIEPLFKSV